MREAGVRWVLTASISARVFMRTPDCIRRRPASPCDENEFHFQDASGILTIRPAMLQKRIDDQPTISRQMVREAQEILHRHLKDVGLKQTAQRDAILHT